MPSSTITCHPHEIAVLQPLLFVGWKGVVLLQDLALRFSHPGRKSLFIRSWQQQSDRVIELEEKIWELGGDTNPSSYEKDGSPADPEDEPLHPFSLNRILLLRGINHLTHLQHLYGEARRTGPPFDVRMILLRHQLQVRETTEQLTSLYTTYPLHRAPELSQAYAS